MKTRTLLISSFALAEAVSLYGGNFKQDVKNFFQDPANEEELDDAVHSYGSSFETSSDLMYDILERYDMCIKRCKEDIGDRCKRRDRNRIECSLAFIDALLEDLQHKTWRWGNKPLFEAENSFKGHWIQNKLYRFVHLSSESDAYDDIFHILASHVFQPEDEVVNKEMRETFFTFLNNNARVSYEEFSYSLRYMLWNTTLSNEQVLHELFDYDNDLNTDIFDNSGSILNGMWSDFYNRYRYLPFEGFGHLSSKIFRFLIQDDTYKAINFEMNSGINKFDDCTNLMITTIVMMKDAIGGKMSLGKGGTSLINKGMLILFDQITSKINELKVNEYNKWKMRTQLEKIMEAFRHVNGKPIRKEQIEKAQNEWEAKLKQKQEAKLKDDMKNHWSNFKIGDKEDDKEEDKK